MRGAVFDLGGAAAQPGFGQTYLGSLLPQYPAHDSHFHNAMPGANTTYELPLEDGLDSAREYDTQFVSLNVLERLNSSQYDDWSATSTAEVIAHLQVAETQWAGTPQDSDELHSPTSRLAECQLREGCFE